MSAVLLALLALPLAGAVLLLLTRAEPPRWYGAAVSGLALAAAVALAVAFDPGRAGRAQFEVDRPWIPGLALRFHLGVDGISLPLVLLTALLTFLCFVYLARHRPEGGRFRALVFTLLILEVGMIGTFLALDLLLFFVFFEIVLIPMYFVIAVWGGAGRGPAAVKFILYTLLGSAVLLLGLLLIWAHTGTLDMVRLAEAHGSGIPRGAQVLAFLAVGLGLAVKAPMWPLHTWLPAAHTEAPTVGSVLLAGVLLKMGTYGFARIAIPLLPEGAAVLAPWLGAFAVAGIVYGSLACLAQRDLKRMIAYSSVGHMGFVLLGLATLTPVGINAALFGNIAHGVITGLLFFLVGAIKERYGTADMSRLGGGLLARLPYIGSLLTFAAVASLGVPGLAGFWGEMLALLGAFHPAPTQPRPLFLTFMAVGGVGTVLTAAYFLLMLSRVTHGRPTEPLPSPEPGPLGGHGPSRELAPSGEDGRSRELGLSGEDGPSPEIRPPGEHGRPAESGPSGEHGLSTGPVPVGDAAKRALAGDEREWPLAKDERREWPLAEDEAERPLTEEEPLVAIAESGTEPRVRVSEPTESEPNGSPSEPAKTPARPVRPVEPVATETAVAEEREARSSEPGRQAGERDAWPPMPEGEAGERDAWPSVWEGEVRERDAWPAERASDADERDAWSAGTEREAGERETSPAGAGRGTVPPGPAVVPGGPPRDLTPYELAAWTPLVALTLALGLWPKLLLSLTDPAVQTFLGAR
ncbi:NADH-quinone oxidoreductase subunit M [Sphaerisporangium album]|uniref:NADH-quinone oxidoreductase subunit M n=1 Tax=Sphaerisporangium album TaxID=509200 RepID=UPI001FE870DB|nr:NADH-quinone oxidoreductase subunit M [Sphaerisporangium album]